MGKGREGGGGGRGGGICAGWQPRAARSHIAVGGWVGIEHRTSPAGWSANKVAPFGVPLGLGEMRAPDTLIGGVGTLR